MLQLPNRPLNIAFFGTPEIAKIMLERLLETHHRLIRVYCQPDRPKGRGKKLVSPPVKQLAEMQGLVVSQPLKLKDGTVAKQLADDEIELAIVVAYGRILPPAVFQAPKYDTWNVHASLLPKLRGASPIQHAILEGFSETGVTLMQLTEGLDEGPMLAKAKLPIAPHETAGELTARLAVLGGQLLVQSLERAMTQGLDPEPQDDAAATFAPLIDKKDGLIDFSRSAQALVHQIRGYDPWPGSFVPTERGPLKLFDGRISDLTAESAAPGEVVSLQPLTVATGSGCLQIGRVQAPGRKAVPAEAYVRGSGRHLEIGGQLGASAK